MRVEDSQLPDGGTSAAGNTSPSKPQPPSEPKSISQEPPPEPRPGQTRPDEKGRCPGLKQVPINGGCWVENPSMTAEECKDNGYAIIRGKCYTPSLARPKKPLPTSSPVEAP